MLNDFDEYNNRYGSYNNDNPRGGPVDKFTIQPIRNFKQRVLYQFRSDKNRKYIQHILQKKVPKHLHNILKNVGYEMYGFKIADELVDSEPIAQRGQSTRGTSFWHEVKKLNIAFVQHKLNDIKMNMVYYDPESVDPMQRDSENWSQRLLIASTLRPPGFEYMNTGPYYNIKEDRVDEYKQVKSKNYNPPRTEGQSILQYWNNADNPMRNTEKMGPTYGDKYSQGLNWGDKSNSKNKPNHGAKFMRYKNNFLPWNRAGYNGNAKNIEDSLWMQMRETGNLIYMQDLGKYHHKQGNNKPNFGPTSYGR